MTTMWSRRHLIAALLAAGGSACGCSSKAAAACPDPDDDWLRFLTVFAEPDGRIVDRDTPALVSTSEGQVYTLFLALVADDQTLFEHVLGWTRNNLAGGDLNTRLPAWQWGRQAPDQWGVLDPNPASDADLWLAYVLLEAGRLWKQPQHTRLGRALMQLIARHEVADVPGLGLMLLPGPTGFVSADRRTWRFNPSYSVLPIWRRLTDADPDGPWRTLADQHVRLLRETCPLGLAADWVAWQLDQPNRPDHPEGRWISDPQHGSTGSYDAIRCYLWAGITSPHDPLRAETLRHLGGLSRLLQTDDPVPERIDTRQGSSAGAGPAGFDAAVLPYLDALGARAPLQTRLQRLVAAQACGTQARYLRYYEHALLLLGTGPLQGRWHLDARGYLQRPARRLSQSH